MARLSQSLLAVLVALAVSASALPTAPDAAQPSGSDVSTEASAKLAHAVLQSAANMMGTMEHASENHAAQQHSQEQPAARQAPAPQEGNPQKQTPTQDEKPATTSSTPSASPSSTGGDLLSNLPLVGGLLGGSSGSGGGGGLL